MVLTFVLNRDVFGLLWVSAFHPYVIMTYLSTAGDRAFVKYPPRAWSKLPEAVKLSSTVAVLKINLQTTLFEFAY